MKPLPIMEKQNALLITIPKSTKWEEYQKELDAVKSEEMEMNFKVSSLPKGVNVGDRCYLVYNGFIVGWMKISFLGEKEFDCTTTGKKWKGNFVSRTGEFHELKKKIPYKGFQGYRYFDYSNID